MTEPTTPADPGSTVWAGPPGEDRTPHRRTDPRAVGRDAAAVLGGLLVLGVVSGVVWWLLVTPADFTNTLLGGQMTENELGKRFASDGMYALVAGTAGLLGGLVLSWWRSRDPLLTTALLLVGSVIAAAAMVLTGHLLGPGDPKAAFVGTKVGARVPERLDVTAFSVYLAWPIGVLAGTLLVLLGRGAEPDPRPDTEPDTRADARPDPQPDRQADPQPGSGA